MITYISIGMQRHMCICLGVVGSGRAVYGNLILLNMDDTEGL
jgi:hypothetical protein